MSNYYIGLYSKNKPFPEDVVQKALTVIQDLIPSFFSANIEISSDVHFEIKAPSDFNYDILPEVFWVEDGVSVRIPITGEDGSELVILDDRDSTLIPSSILITWSNKGTLPKTEIIEALFKNLIETLEPTSAMVTEENMRLRNDIYERSFAVDNTILPESLNWMTWLSPKHILTIGDENIHKIKSEVSIVPCASGYILTLQKEPYVDANNEHLIFREKIESELGLTDIYKNL